MLFGNFKRHFFYNIFGIMIQVINLVVYADILVALNLIVNYFLLLTCCKVLKFKYKVLRLLISSLVGALSSLYIFLPKLPIFYEFLFKLLLCSAMIYIALPFKTVKQYIKTIGVFFIITCGYAGIMIAFWHIFKPNGMIINNSVVYFNISPVILVSVSVVSYFIFLLINNIFKVSSNTARRCEITVDIENIKLELKGIVDTGNSLCDVFGKSEIIIADKRAVASIYNKWGRGGSKEIKSRFRIIPCNTVTGQDVLEGIRCDRATIRSDQKNVELVNPIVAVSKVSFNDDYNAIINPSILD